MLRYKTVKLPFTTSGQETELVYSFNLGARTGPTLQQGMLQQSDFGLAQAK